ncbi:MAG: right-handed parallel beta-helix repeat-containing protein, partial [Candidatus Thorarchaeota archaeon]
MEGQPENRVTHRSDVCKIPSKSNGKVGKNGYGHLRPRTIFMAVGLTFILTTGLAYVWMLKPPPLPPPPLPPLPSSPDPGTPHGAITIDGDANFSDTALLEGWPGDGSPENPYIIDGLDIDLDGNNGSCISISNTRVSFTISNCNLTGASGDSGTGIWLSNVTNGELVNNICNNNRIGISLGGSDSNTVANNTCNSNSDG